MKKEKQQRFRREFSKFLLLQESALMWIVTITAFVLAFFCVVNGYCGELPWVVALISLPWTAYGVSQAFYYRKAQAENTEGGIIYEREHGSKVDLEQLKTLLEEEECKCQEDEDDPDNYIL